MAKCQRLDIVDTSQTRGRRTRLLQKKPSSTSPERSETISTTPSSTPTSPQSSQPPSNQKTQSPSPSPAPSSPSCPSQIWDAEFLSRLFAHGASLRTDAILAARQWLELAWLTPQTRMQLRGTTDILGSFGRPTSASTPSPRASPTSGAAAIWVCCCAAARVRTAAPSAPAMTGTLSCSTFAPCRIRWLQRVGRRSTCRFCTSW